MKSLILFSIIVACGFVENVVSDNNQFPYKTILNFGDSVSDTGNSVTKEPFGANSPYGSTYFKHPAGRMSNGRLIIDFIAKAYGLPFLPAYLNLTKGQHVKQGVNFAFSGSTALDKSFFDQRGLDVPKAAYGLSTQFEWFQKLKPSLCTGKEDCATFFNNTLVLVGEIGGNDINAIIPRKNLTEVREFVPHIVQAIANMTSKLIEEGAVHLVVPGNFPIGCISYVLNQVNSNKTEDFDEFGCLRNYNAAIKYYHDQLKTAVDELRQKNPHVIITYFNYYSAARRLFENPEQYGFKGKPDTFKVCCGKGGRYNLNEICGLGNSVVCEEPSKHINWDGFHLTEAGYRAVAQGLLEGPYATPPLKTPPFKIPKE
ncbi:GDSL esterase/lipase At5g45910-like [Vigna unguiculata]|uniref:Zeta-carotene desaturase n=1 Tax=Vigna unguiculata TaxID=3917 RepID=A0A4D6NPQ3_VIGUN|nr:GDSL esterase/lipase At5g45910-like [Vigna unguiculata]QCE14205.1 zeta-carotene desaturase [Vigna unguiculata]